MPNARVGGIGLTAGFASGISGAGWGPIGVKLLILTRIDPKQAIGSSLFARIFMAAAAVVGYIIAATAFQNVARGLVAGRAAVRRLDRADDPGRAWSSRGWAASGPRSRSRSCRSRWPCRR